MFAIVDDLATYTQFEFDQVQEIQAQQAIAAATKRIRRWTGQTIFPVTTGATFERHGVRKRILLPHPQVIPVSVTRVEIDGDELDSSEWIVDDLHILTRASGVAWRGHVVVTYTHGFSDVPEDVQDVCLSVASRAIGNPEGLMQMKLGDQSASFASEPGVALGLDRSHKDALLPFRLPGAA